MLNTDGAMLMDLLEPGSYESMDAQGSLVWVDLPMLQKYN